jgi:peptidyl-prolyl cis-trans isomerase C
MPGPPATPDLRDRTASGDAPAPAAAAPSSTPKTLKVRFMKSSLATTVLAASALCAGLLAPLGAQAQNIAVVNGKAVPKARVDALMTQITKQAAARGQQLPPDIDKLVRDKVVLDEMFIQEAEKRGLAASTDYKAQMEIARENILVQALLTDYEAKNPVTDADIKAEYDKFKAQSSGTEYRARHILVENEDQAKALIAQIKGGAKFEDLAKKNSKDPGSGENGGDLDFAAPAAYVPEFSQAMVKLKKGEMTETPVKTQFGYHIIRLDDTREAKFPPLEEVKPQIQQRLAQQKVAAFRDEIRAKAKTDYKFSQ